VELAFEVVKENDGLIETKETHLIEFGSGVVFVPQPRTRGLAAETNVGQCTVNSLDCHSRGLR
jgi:hypothetical protein